LRQKFYECPNRQGDFKSKQRPRGTLLICIILGLVVRNDLYMVQRQRQWVAPSQDWNQAIVVAEAIVDDAVALMNSGVIAGNVDVVPSKDASGGNETRQPWRRGERA